MLKKFFRLIIDLAVAAGVVTAIILGIVALTGPLADWKDLLDKGVDALPGGQVLANSNVSTNYWLAMSGLIAAGIAAVPTAISIVFFFRKREGWGWTIFAMLLMFAALTLTAIAAHKNGQLVDIKDLGNLIP